MNNNVKPGIPSEISLDPTLQRCITDLLKCYAEKVQDTRLSDKDSLMSSTTMNNKNENVKLNKNVGSVSNTDNHNDDDDASEAHSSLNCNSTSDSQASHLMSHSCYVSSSRTESRRSKPSKTESNCKDQQSTSNLKPPWK